MIDTVTKFAKRMYWKAAGIPHVTTTYGHDRCDKLRRLEGVAEDHRARAEWVEYYKPGIPGITDEELVHRSVTIALKQSIDLGAAQGIIS